MAGTKSGTKSGSSPGDVFEVERIRQFVELMKEHDLSELDLRQEDKRIRLRRGDVYPVAAYAASPTASVALPATPPPVASPSPHGTAAPLSRDTDDKNIHIIKSPMVGTFYTRPKPDAEPFVRVGDHVSPSTTVCLIEAMKVFNEIPADCTGQIVAVLVECEQPVDVDKPLFKVDTSK